MESDLSFLSLEVLGFWPLDSHLLDLCYPVVLNIDCFSIPSPPPFFFFWFGKNMGLRERQVGVLVLSFIGCVIWINPFNSSVKWVE